MLSSERRPFKLRRKISQLIALIFTIGVSLPSFSQEGRPGHEFRRTEREVSDRQELKNEESRSISEKRVEDRQERLLDRAEKQELRESREPTSVDAKSLHDLQVSDEKRKTNQAEHAWNVEKEGIKRADAEFRKRDIRSPDELKQRAQDIRERYDWKIDLMNDKVVYFKLDEGNDSGIIVLDNPHAENGGTIMTNDNLHKKSSSLYKEEGKK